MEEDEPISAAGVKLLQDPYAIKRRDRDDGQKGKDAA
jgi:hypothetical protein